MIRPWLLKQFKPAFLGRLKVIPYFPITDEVLGRIIALKLGKLQRRIAANHKADFCYEESLLEAVLARCTEVDAGARNIDHILNGTLLPQIAELVLARMAEGVAFSRIGARADRDGSFHYAIT